MQAYVAGAAAVAAIVALSLQGCGDTSVNETVTTTTTSGTTVTTTTMTTTTATTTTSRTEVGHCLPGTLNLRRMDPAMWCFCFYSGGCQDHFVCRQGEPKEQCMQRYCGEHARWSTEETVAFLDFKFKQDVLTIPRMFYADTPDMKAHCDDAGEEMMERFLALGREAYLQSGIGGEGVPAEWQCVHLPGYLGVHWLHVHTFRGVVKSERLPSGPPVASCALASLPVAEAARTILAQVKLPKPHPRVQLNATDASLII
eukprot:TRINITY_DN14425_c0_g1_i1.p1 TRINITY_DN14425_c0_g1~~TRINITY_DN14425_c0_g1_i1.p1  ORF type:complete len:269 (+),score=30.00 TRINITY_DN14425_c0_g1_i1:38-808(+)